MDIGQISLYYYKSFPKSYTYDVYKCTEVPDGNMKYVRGGT